MTKNSRLAAFLMMGLCACALISFEPTPVGAIAATPTATARIAATLQAAQAISSTATSTATATTTSTPTPTSTSTATPTASPTALPTATPTLSPTPIGADAYEPNDLSTIPTLIGVGQPANATLHIGDMDWWKVYLKPGRTYRIKAEAGQGDPLMELYSPSMALLAQNDDCAPGDPSPCIVYPISAEGFYLLRIASKVAGLFATYTFSAVEQLPTPTKSPTPSSTPVPTTPEPTQTRHPNGSFDEAAEITAGQSVQANMPHGSNDFYRLYVKAGLVYLCDVNPQPGLDTNLIVYDANRNGIGGNDDKTPGNPGSALSWPASYTGWAYLLIGPVAGQGRYTLLCSVVLPTPTLTAVPRQPSVPVASLLTSTPTRNSIPTATGGPAVGGNGQPVVGNMTPGAGGAWSNATATPIRTPLPPIKVVVYYDENNNKAPEPEEGIRGAWVILLDASTNKPVEQKQTDLNGAVSFVSPPVTEFSTLRITIPYLGFSKQVAAGQIETVRVEPQRLPSLIP